MPFKHFTGRDSLQQITWKTSNFKDFSYLSKQYILLTSMQVDFFFSDLQTVQ